MKLTQVDVLAKDRSSTIASAIGGDVDQIRRSVSIDSEPSLKVTPIVGASTWQDFAERRILKLTYASAPIELWEIEQIGFSRGQQPGQKGLTCRPLWMRLDDQIAHLTLSDGTKDPNLTLTSVGVTTALSRVLGAAWNSPAFINPGSIDAAIQGGIVNLFRPAATHKEWLTAIKEDLNVQWTARWDSAAGEYKVDLVERIGDSDASVRSIRETPQAQGDIVNRLSLRGERSVDNYFSGVVPLGGTKNQSLTMAGARWPISSTSYDSTGDETTIVFQDEPVWDDGALTNAQVTNGGSAHAVQSSTAPDQVVVSGDISGWDVLWFVDSNGDDLIELRDLGAESQVGRRTRSKQFSGVVPQENLLERAGVNTAADSLDGWAAIGSNTNLTIVTSGDYVRNGDGSIEVITSTADAEEGLRTSSIAFDKAEMGEVVSAFVAVYVAGGGTIQVQLVDTDGKEYPADETIEGGEATLRGYTIEGAKPPTGSLFLKVTTLSGDPAFYVDAATIVASAKARGFAPAMGPRALWQKGAGYLLREGGVPDRTLDGQVIDLSVLESQGKELTLGDATTVILHDGTEIEGRITSTQRDLVVGSDTTAFQVALGEPIDNALDRFFDPPSGEPPGDGTGGTDRVQPVLTEVEMNQNGSTGELSFAVSDPLGVVQKVQTRTAAGRNLDPDNDAYADLTPAAGTYTETVRLVESHNSYIQVRVVTGPQVDDVTREFAFDRDQIPEASYEVKWQYSQPRDTVEVVLVAKGGEDADSYKLQLDQNRDGTFDETVLVDGRTASEVLNPNLYLTPGEKVDIWGRAYSEAGQGGNPEEEVFSETYEVPDVAAEPTRSPQVVAYPEQDGSTGILRFGVDDSDQVVTQVEARTAEGRNLLPSDDWTTLEEKSLVSLSMDGEHGSGTYEVTVPLTEVHDSIIQVALRTVSGFEDVVRDYQFDRDQIPSADYQTKWFWNAGRGAVELYMVSTGDEDVYSYQYGVDVDQDGTDEETVTVGDSSRVRSDTVLLNPTEDLTPGASIAVTATAYSETGQGGNVQPEDFEEVLQVPTRQQAITKERPVINAELIEKDSSTGRLEWRIDDPDNVVTQVEVRTKQGDNFDGEGFSSPSETNPYAEEVGLVPLHNSYIEVKLTTGPGVENVRQTYTFDPDDLPSGDITLGWEWSGDSQELTVNYVGDDDVESWKFQADLDNNGTYETEHNTNTEIGTQTINPSTTLAGGDTIGLKITCYTKDGQSGNSRVMFDGTLGVPLPREEVPETRPTITAETLEPDSTTGRVEWTVDDPDNVVNSVEVRAKQGDNFDGEGFSSPSETNPYAEEVTIQPAHNSFIEVRLVTESGIDNIRKLFVFDPDEEPTGDITFVWDWNGNSHELTVNYVGDDDVESWKFQADLDNNGTYETEHNTNSDAGTQTINPSTALNGGDTIGLKITCYADDGQSGNSKVMFDGTLGVPLPREEVPVTRPTISAETLEPNDTTGRVEWAVDDPDNVVNSVEVRTKQGDNFDGEGFASPSETNPYAEEVTIQPAHNSFIEVRLVTESGIENIRKLFVFDPDEEPTGDITFSWDWNGGSQELTVNYVGDDDVESWKFEADLDDNGTYETEHNANTDAGAQTINPNTTLSGGDTIDLKITAYTKDGQSGNSKTFVDGTLEVPLPRGEVPVTRPSISAEMSEPSSTTGRVTWTVDDPDGVVDSVEARSKEGDNFDGENFGSPDGTNPYVEDVGLSGKHNSYVEVRLVTESGIENVRQTYTFDPDEEIEGNVDLFWRWDGSNSTQRLLARYNGDDDVESWEFTVDFPGGSTTTQTRNDTSGDIVLNPNTSVKGGDTLTVTITAYTEDGQSGESRELWGSNLDVPLPREEVPVSRPTISAETLEPNDTTGRVEWAVDDPDNVVNSVEVRTKQGDNFNGEGFGSPSETNPYAEEVTIGPSHNSFIEVRLVTESGIENIRKLFVFDPDAEPNGTVELRWQWDDSNTSQRLVVEHVGDDDVESWKFEADLDNNGTYETEHNTNTDAGAQTINPNTTLSGGDTIDLKITAYTKDGQSGNSKVVFDGSLDVPLPREEVSSTRPTITGETLEPDPTTGRVEWTVDDPDNVVNSVEVRTKQGDNFNGEGFGSPSETNPYAEEVTIGPSHNSFIEVRLVTESGIDNVRTLFVFDPDDNPHGTVELRWRWNYSDASQELTVNHVGDNDVESWKFQADLDNNGTFETEYNTNSDAGARTINPNTTLSGGDTIGLKITCYAKGGQSGNSNVLFDGALDVPLHREEVPEARASITVEDVRTFRSGSTLFGEVEWAYDDPEGIVQDTDVRVAVGENLSGGFQTPDDDTSPYSETVTIEGKHTSYIEVRLVTDSGFDNVRQVFPFDADEQPEGSFEIRWEYDSGLRGIKGVIVATGDDDVASWQFTIDDGSNSDTQTVDGQSVTQQLNTTFSLDPGQTVSINADAYAKTGQSGTVNSILNSETFVVMADIDAVADGDGVVIEGKHILLDGATTIDGGLDLFQTAYHHPQLKSAVQNGKLIERVTFNEPNSVSGNEFTGPLNGRRYKLRNTEVVSGEGPHDISVFIDPNNNTDPRVAVEFKISQSDPEVAVGGWVKVPEGETGGVIASQDESEYYRMFVDSNGILKVALDNGVNLDTGKALNDGRWHHVQFASRDKGGATRFLVYIDGSIYVNRTITGDFGTGATRYLMLGRGSEASSYDGSISGGGQITFYLQDWYCFKGGNWDNDLAVPMASAPDAFAPVGRVHGDLLVEDTVRAEVLDVEQIFAEDIAFSGSLEQTDGNGETIFAVTAGSQRRILIKDDSSPPETTALLTKAGNLRLNQISGYGNTASDAISGSGESTPSNVEEYLVVQTDNGARRIPAYLPPDTKDPATPQNLSASDDASDQPSIELDWDDVTQDVEGGTETIDHYNVYRSSSSGGSYSLLAEAPGSQYTDYSVSDGDTFYYKVSAVDDAGNEGGKSSSASATAQQQDARLR